MSRRELKVALATSCVAVLLVGILLWWESPARASGQLQVRRHYYERLLAGAVAKRAPHDEVVELLNRDHLRFLDYLEGSKPPKTIIVRDSQEFETFTGTLWLRVILEFDSDSRLTKFTTEEGAMTF